MNVMFIFSTVWIVTNYEHSCVIVFWPVARLKQIKWRFCVSSHEKIRTNFI